MPASISRAIRRFEAAVRAHDNKGAQHPSDWDQIERNYRKTKDDLCDAIGIARIK